MKINSEYRGDKVSGGNWKSYVHHRVDTAITIVPEVSFKSEVLSLFELEAHF